MKPESNDPAEVIAAVFGDLAPELQERQLLAKCQSLWPELAGTLSKHSYPWQMRGDRLEVRIEQAVYHQEFQLLSREILRKIQASTGARVKRLKLVRGQIDWERIRTEAIDPYQPELKKKPEELNDGQRELLDGLTGLDKNL